MFSLTLIKYVQQRLQLISPSSLQRGGLSRGSNVSEQNDKSFPITLQWLFEILCAQPSLIGLNESNEIENKIKLQVFMLSERVGEGRGGDSDRLPVRLYLEV